MKLIVKSIFLLLLFYSSIGIASSNLYAAVGESVYKSIDEGDSWRPVSQVSDIYPIVMAEDDSGVIYLGGIAGEPHILMKSIDQGLTWLPIDDDIFSKNIKGVGVKSFLVTESYLLAGFDIWGIVASTNNAGQNWYINGTGMANGSVYQMGMLQGPSQTATIFAAPYCCATFQAGLSDVSKGLPSKWYPSPEGVNGQPGESIFGIVTVNNSSNVYAAADNIVYVMKWSPLSRWIPLPQGLPGSSNPMVVNLLATDGSFIYAAGYYGVFRLKDGDNVWQKTPITTRVNALLVKNKMLYAVTSTNHIFKSYNQGVTWKECDAGLVVKPGDNIILG